MASVAELKLEVDKAIAAGQWGLVSALGAQIKTLTAESSPTLSPASSTTTAIARQTSTQEHSATLRAREAQRRAEADEAELDGALSRTRAEYVQSLRDGTPTPMSRGALKQSYSRVFGDDEDAQSVWSQLEPTISFNINGDVVGFDEDLALEPLHMGGDDAYRGLGSARKAFLDRNLSSELMREGSGGMTNRYGPRPTASMPDIDTPLPDGMSLLYNEVAAEQAAARSAWETQQYSMERLWGAPSISEQELPAAGGGPQDYPGSLTKEIGSVRSRMFAPRSRTAFPGGIEEQAAAAEAEAAAAAGASASAGFAVGRPPVAYGEEGEAEPEALDQSMLPPPPGVVDTRPAHVIDPTWGRVGRSYSTSKPRAARTGRTSGDKERTSGGKAGKKQKKKRVVTKDPNKPKPKPWSDQELAHFRHLLDTEGPNGWAAKAAKLGTGAHLYSFACAAARGRDLCLAG